MRITSADSRKPPAKGRVKKWFALAVLALCCGNPAVLYAGSGEVVASSGGKDMFDVRFFDAGEEGAVESLYTLSAPTKRGVLEGLSYWADLLGDKAKNQKPAQVFVGADGAANASAQAIAFVGNQPAEDLFFNQAIQDGKRLSYIDPADEATLKGCSAAAVITVGRYLGAARKGSQYGWYVDDATVLPTNEQASDLVGTIRHEMGHALGIAAALQAAGGRLEDEDGDRLYAFSGQTADPRSWSAHLIDQNGNRAKAGMEIITSAEFNRRRAQNPALRASAFFIVDNPFDGARDAAKPTAGHLYFVGENVGEALDGAVFDGVAGLPVNGWEGDAPEFSHLQTAGMMSHRSYSNYTAFMEAELAAMQDLGYRIDRKNYFGRSVYGDGMTLVNRRGYSARNAAGTSYLPGVYNATPLGVGLHVYGSHNTITQAADVLTVGRGAVGARVDGADNTVRIAKNTRIRADGPRGVGVLVAYGGNHTLTQAGVVTATGEGGVGVRFDFGSSSNGAQDEYRGSYIRYERQVDEKGRITDARNLAFALNDGYRPATPELAGPLAGRYDLSGCLAGRENAVYIGKNAFVGQINILDGAFIQGDITSDWKHFAADGRYYDGGDAGSEALAIQYGGGSYAYGQYIPDLVTRLRFNAHLAYDGDIHGADNMKIDVRGGALRYGGRADVVSVTVEKGAELIGGGYQLNDMSARLAPGWTDPDAGKFINHGTIGAATPAGADTAMSIDGALESDGRIRFTANKNNVGYVDVRGGADFAASSLVIDEGGVYAPHRSYGDDFVRVNGRAAGGGFAKMEPYETGMMTAAYQNNAISFYPEDHLGAKTAAQTTMYNAVNRVLAKDHSLGEAYAQLYSLRAAAAKETLSSLYGGIQPEMAGIVKNDGFVSDAASGRLQSRGQDDGGVWFTMQRSWQGLDGNGDLPAMKDQVWRAAVGKDKRVGGNWVAGWLFAYGRHDVNAGDAAGKIRDYRFGLYGGYAKDALAVDTYLAYGRQRNTASRGVANLGLFADSDYDSNLIGAGVKVRRDLQHGDQSAAWHVSPYVRLDAARYSQDGYAETGAGAYGQRARGFSDSIVTAGLGLEAARQCGAKGSYTVLVGYRRILAGGDDVIESSLAPDDRETFLVRGDETARNGFTAGLRGEIKLRDDFSVGGEVKYDWGAATYNMLAAVHAEWKF